MSYAYKTLFALLTTFSVYAQAEVFELTFEATDIVNLKQESIPGSVKGSFLLNSDPSYGFVPTKLLGINLSIFGHQYNLIDVSLSPQPSVFTIGENNFGTNTVSYETDDFIFNSRVELNGTLYPLFSYTQKGVSDYFKAGTVTARISAIPEPSKLEYIFIAIVILGFAKFAKFFPNRIRQKLPVFGIPRANAV